MLLRGYVEWELNIGHGCSLVCRFFDSESDFGNKMRKWERRIRIYLEILSRKPTTRKFEWVTEVRQPIFYLMLMQNLSMLFGWRKETEEGRDWDKEERRKINPVTS